MDGMMILGIVLLAVMLTVMNPGEFMCCHKSYIVNLSMISKLEPYGRWTYVVKFKGTKETALMTFQKYEELKKLFG